MRDIFEFSLVAWEGRPACLSRAERCSLDFSHDALRDIPAFLSREIWEIVVDFVLVQFVQINSIICTEWFLCFSCCVFRTCFDQKTSKSNIKKNFISQSKKFIGSLIHVPNTVVLAFLITIFAISTVGSLLLNKFPGLFSASKNRNSGCKLSSNSPTNRYKLTLPFCPPTPTKEIW